MRHLLTVTLTALAMVLVVAAPTAAQDTAEDREYQPTQPGAGSQAPHDGLTIYGTVQEFDGEQLVIGTETGAQYLQIVTQTQYPSTLEPGTEVAVDYNRTSQGVMIATQIRPKDGDETVEQSGVAVETRAETVEAETARETEVEAEAETTMARETPEPMEPTEAETAERTAERTETRARADELPMTGSDLPLIALLGLIGIAGAGAVHVLRS